MDSRDELLERLKDKKNLQKMISDFKRNDEMIACVKKLKKLCKEERRVNGDCDHGCPLAGYLDDGGLICTLQQIAEDSNFSRTNSCYNWNIHQWTRCDDDETSLVE